MYSFAPIRYFVATALTATLLAGCSQSGSSEQPQSASTKAPAAEIQVPAGRYQLDRDHSSLHFSVMHLGLSNYVARFKDYDVSLDLQPDDMSKSSVTISIDPNSVAVDYFSDYNETHPDVEYDSWTETLAKSDKFFNAGEYPEISYRSTAVEQTAPGKFRVTGDLTLLGQTHPVTLDAKVTGSTAEHPMSGAPAIGFSATGSFKRSAFGMDHLLDPPLVGDEVTLYFEGEFLQAAE